MPRAGDFSFDPVAVGRSECDAWAAYYRREWRRFLRSALAMVRSGFALGPLSDLRGAWYVLRANQVWAPYPDNDPDAARRSMAGFYRLTSRAGRLDVDPVRAADLEVSWWHAHRQHQHDPAMSVDELTDALVRLYAYVYRGDQASVRLAAEQRVAAMELSDAWVAAGCRMDDPLLAAERLALVASYAALREGSERARFRPA